MELTLEQQSKQAFDVIQEVLSDAISKDSPSVPIENMIRIFLVYIEEFKELAITPCYDFCISGRSKIMLCMVISAAITTTINLTLQQKLLFLYNTCLNSNWIKVQEFIIQNLKVLKGVDELSKLKVELKETKLLDMIDEPLSIIPRRFNFFSFLKRIFS